ncbi:MAG: mechanosensitive ion channel family protein [Flavobacteriales bacterium]|nr:mechanosensitive ion channel family protein [Flavobacteriales bacterium]
MNWVNEFLLNLKENLPNILVGLGILLFSLALARMVKKIVRNRINPKSKNPLIARFISQLVSVIIVLVGLTLFFKSVGLGFIATTIFTGAGIMTFVIGFAFKDIGENFLSGILMAFKSPFQIGDLVETQGIVGYVTELNLRETVIKSLDGKDVFIPNSKILNEPLFNYTIDGFLRYDFIIGVDYQENILEVTEMIEKAVSAVSGVLAGERKPIVYAHEFQTNTINIRVVYWVDTLSSKTKSSHFLIRSKAMDAVAKLLREKGIGMPANIMEIKNYDDQAIQVSNNQA